MSTPLFQHRHFCFIAHECARQFERMGDDNTPARRAFETFVDHLTASLARTNPQFDWNRFQDAARGQSSGRDRVR